MTLYPGGYRARMNPWKGFIRCTLFFRIFLLGGYILSVDASSRGTPSSQSLDLGIEYLFFQYKEPGIMEEKGPMAGVFARWTIFQKALFLSGYGSYTTGDVRYEGGQQDFQTGRYTPITDSTPNRIVHLRGEMGWEVLGERPLKMGVYAGGGYRYLYNDLLSDQEGGYERQQVYFYVPVGLYLEERRHAWRWGGRLEYDFLLLGLHRVSFLDETFEQTEGWGMQGSVFIGYTPSPGSMQISIEPFFRYWDLADSTVITQDHPLLGLVEFSEPANQTSIMGVQAMVRF